MPATHLQLQQQSNLPVINRYYVTESMMCLLNYDILVQLGSLKIYYFFCFVVLTCMQISANPLTLQTVDDSFCTSSFRQCAI